MAFELQYVIWRSTFTVFCLLTRIVSFYCPHHCHCYDENYFCQRPFSSSSKNPRRNTVICHIKTYYLQCCKKYLMRVHEKSTSSWDFVYLSKSKSTIIKMYSRKSKSNHVLLCTFKVKTKSTVGYKFANLIH